MGKIYRKFDAKFKREVCEAIASGQMTAKEICQEHQLHYQTVKNWLTKFEQGTPLGKPSAREKMLEKENAKLYEKIGKLSIQIDLLKKFHETVQQRRSADLSVITGKNLARFQKLAAE